MFFAINLLSFFGALYADANGQIRFVEEFKDFNSSCHPIVNCTQVRPYDISPGVSINKPCSCHRMCSQFDTCCLDASGTHSKQVKVKPICRQVKSPTFKWYLMIDRCSSGDDDDSVWKELCNDESKAGDNDLMSQVPVTSLFSSITYKNYFCMRCHEATDDFVYWNLQLKGNSSQEIQPGMEYNKLVYSKRKKTWVVILKESFFFLPVDWYLQIPPEIEPSQAECMFDIISECSSSWSDDSVRRKCYSYTSIIHIWRNSRQTFKYRNPHCAACSFEDLSKNPCKSAYEEEGIGSSVKYNAGSITEKYDAGSSTEKYDASSSTEKYDASSITDGHKDRSISDKNSPGSIRDTYGGGYMRHTFDVGSNRRRYEDSSIGIRSNSDSTRDRYNNDSIRRGYDNGSIRVRHDNGSIRNRDNNDYIRDRYDNDSISDRYDDRYRDRYDDKYGDYVDRSRDRYDVTFSDRYIPRNEYIEPRPSGGRRAIVTWSEVRPSGGRRASVTWSGVRPSVLRDHIVHDNKKILFSFTHLLDINRSDGDKVGKLKMCADNSLWDPWADTCRELSCPIPGYTLQGRKCVPPRR